MIKTVEFRLTEIETVTGYIGRCDICDEECTNGYYYQSIHKNDCVQTFKGSHSGHKQCLIDYRKQYRKYRQK